MCLPLSQHLLDSFQSGKYCDCDVALTFDGEELLVLPAHKVFISSSELLAAQLAPEWQQGPSKRRRTRQSSDVATADDSNMPRITLVLDSAGQLEAAQALIKSLYGVQGPFSALSDQQLLDAALLADQWLMLSAMDAILQQFKAEQGRMSEQACRSILQLPNLPASMMPLFKQAIKDILRHGGDAAAVAAVLGPHATLNELWGDEKRRQLVLDLDLPTCELLLSSDKLKVASEDDVLFLIRQQAAWKDWESRVVRVSRLSAPWLNCLGPQATGRQKQAWRQLAVMRASDSRLAMRSQEIQRRIPALHPAGCYLPAPTPSLHMV